MSVSANGRYRKRARFQQIRRSTVDVIVLRFVLMGVGVMSKVSGSNEVIERIPLIDFYSADVQGKGTYRVPHPLSRSCVRDRPAVIGKDKGE